VFHDEPYDVEYRTVSPDGRVRWFRAKGRAYFDATGAPTASRAQAGRALRVVEGVHQLGRAHQLNIILYFYESGLAREPSGREADRER
jgi:hypothetical protein